MDPHESAEVVRPSTLWGIDRRSVLRLAYLVLLGLVGLRAVSEIGMIRVHGPDAQLAIWWAFLVIKILLWMAVGTLFAGLLYRAWPRRGWSTACLVAMLIWAAAIGRATWQYNEGRKALADAASSSTSPERLSELVHFGGIQAGYELDNRLAANRNTPPEALRELSKRIDQQGTQMLLAKNPHTPEDVRGQLKQ